ncbi:MAG TPA: ribosome silencing factor [Acidobacteria bacterium]|jgi:ribosome-associated protein|nr:ribosome silencing factor [Acidobacteriota bacterium]|tara:strand:+ start:614 stop:1012 length:399 start_codon:yes stop_codon:yes gene_type:complete
MPTKQNEPFITNATTHLPESVRRAVKAMHDKKGTDVVILDFRGTEVFTDFFVMCSGQHVRQVKAIADSVATHMRTQAIKPTHVEGYNRADWVLMDFFDFVVHIFTPETRSFYSLERLWASGKRLCVDNDKAG